MFKKLAANRYWNFSADLLFNLFGTALFAAAMRIFIVPNQIAPGGISGLTVVLNHLIPIVSIGTWSLIINIPLLLIGYRFLGKRFTIKTLCTVVLMTVMVDYVMINMDPYTGNPLLAALFGGVFEGFSLALIYTRGSTTGGSDIISKLILMKRPHIQMGRVLLSIDLIVIMLGAAVFRSLEAALYGIVVVYVSSRVVDTVLYGRETGKLVYVISEQTDQIASEVLHKLGRGCTLLQSKGAFTQKERHIIFIAVRKPQFPELKRMVYRIDPCAFIIVTDSSEVIGEGFKPIDG